MIINGFESGSRDSRTTVTHPVYSGYYNGYENGIRIYNVGINIYIYIQIYVIIKLDRINHNIIYVAVSYASAVIRFWTITMVIINHTYARDPFNGISTSTDVVDII